MGKMTVYHGSYTSVKNPRIIKGRNTKDFGTGFYCTITREQFWSLAKFNIQPIRSILPPMIPSSHLNLYHQRRYPYDRQGRQKEK